MSRAICHEPDCEWEAEAPSAKIAESLLYRHFADEHNRVEF